MNLNIAILFMQHYLCKYILVIIGYIFRRSIILFIIEISTNRVSNLTDERNTTQQKR